MKLETITVEKNMLRFCLDEAFSGPVTLREETPVVHGTPRLVAQEELAFTGGAAACARFADGHDRALSRFFCRQGGTELEGAHYVTDFAPDVPENVYPYPQPDTIKTLVCPHEEGREFGIKQSRFDVNLPAMVALEEQPDTIPYEFEGQTYYFYRDSLEKLEKNMAGYEVNTLILLNAPSKFFSHEEQALLDVCIHPKYEWGDPGAFISAFNMTTEAGQRVYGAFVSFLAERYTRADKKYGRIGGVIISNEINLQTNWGNVGEMPVKDYVEEYSVAMRLAWLCGKRHYSGFRVYVSLANNWNELHENPLRLYHGRDIIDHLGVISARDGDFPWHVAHHPYPESWLPDFWNDRRATFDFATPKITYKNMEVLEAYLAQPQLLYRGTPRRIVFSEQGFNAENGPLRDLQEKQAAAGYVLEYLKARNMKTVDMMANHSYLDNLHEFGLNLGIFRYDPDAPNHRGEAKPIAAAVKAMDTPAEEIAILFAREIISPELFDYLLHPTVLCGDPDRSSETEFG
ncbi:DUF5722 domain-containing protein [Hydrogeniiclostridium mannosilyticum]|uniref:DUF5722 domain-containing protein n=1 Tax=Hydrogeniiclostridium mannosilyticum TaxID=2764322 RepID=UPI0018AB8ACA|nr:DUF5722 domain-containing protein [Hydrogeniiclostridium mannosilyticum]MBS6163463.1 hypothetical protein [Clostridiales bacterium]